MRKSILITFLLFSLVNCSVLFANERNSIEIEISKKYLNLPVSETDDFVKLSITENNSIFRIFDIKLANSKPDYWVFVDVSKLIGKTVQLKIENTDQVHKGLAKIYQANTIAGSDSLYKEKLRQQFHFSTKRGWTNDPNGLVWYDDEYHLFYQHSPFNVHSRNMHWGHAVSTDLLHWEELDNAILPERDFDIWSGSVVIDHNNTSGFQKGKEKVMVAAYTAAHIENNKNDYTVQSLAYSNDRGRTWTKYENNPVIGNLNAKWGTRHIRDPKIFWYAPGEHWVMVLFAQLGHSIYTSDNLKDWTFQSHTEGFYECPELIELPVDGDRNNTKWIMYGAAGSYAIGEFNGKEFIWESGKHRYKSGKLYAAQTFNNIPESDGRCIQMAWGRISSPGMPFNQMMLFPTELSLRTTRNGIRLFCEPIKEIGQLQGKKYQWKNLTKKEINEKLKNFTAETYHIKCEIETIDSPKFGVEIDGNRQICDILNGDFFNEAPFFLAPGKKTVQLEILVDKTSIETFVENGELYSITAKDLNAPEKGIQFWTIGRNNKIIIRNLEIYELESIWK